MTVDLTGIIKITGAKLELDTTAALDALNFLGETYTFDAPLSVKGEIYNNGGTLSLKARVRGAMQTRCARCLKPIGAIVDFDIDELLSRSDDKADKEGDVILFTGHEIDLDDIVTDNFLMKVPGRYLCREDCRGLCPVCGHDLNEGECGCVRETIDPRWQPLIDIMRSGEQGSNTKK